MALCIPYWIGWHRDLYYTHTKVTMQAKSWLIATPSMHGAKVPHFSTMTMMYKSSSNITDTLTPSLLIWTSLIIASGTPISHASFLCCTVGFHSVNFGSSLCLHQSINHCIYIWCLMWRYRIQGSLSILRVSHTPIKQVQGMCDTWEWWARIFYLTQASRFASIMQCQNCLSGVGDILNVVIQYHLPRLYPCATP